MIKLFIIFTIASIITFMRYKIDKIFAKQIELYRLNAKMNIVAAILCGIAALVCLIIIIVQLLTGTIGQSSCDFAISFKEIAISLISLGGVYWFYKDAKKGQQKETHYSPRTRILLALGLGAFFIFIIIKLIFWFIALF